MNPRPKITALVAAAALGALPMYALADDAEIYYAPTVTYIVPADTHAAPSPTYLVPGVVYVVPAAPQQEVTYATPAITYVEPIPVTYVEPPITVYGSPADEDQAITNDVVFGLASDSRLSGKIGVETSRNVVTLSGRVTTPGQAEIARRDAQSVEGVEEVRSLLRTKVGG